MPDSKQLQIIKKVQAIIESINPDNTDPITEAAYAVDLSSAVFPNIENLGASDPTPAITILESPKPYPTDDLTGEDRAHPGIETMVLLVQGFAEKGEDGRGGPAYALKALVEQALSRVIQSAGGTSNGGKYPADFMLGKVNGKYLVTSFTIQTGGVRPPKNGVSPTAFFYLPLVIKFSFNPTNPYL